MKKTPYILAVLLCASEVIKAQCAMCKAVVESGDQEIAESLNNGITFLMAMPYLLVGGLFYALYRYNKRLKN